MAMQIKNNIDSLKVRNTLNKNTKNSQSKLAKLASGMKINSAGDDASGYSISERMRVQINALSQAEQNTQNGSSMLKVAEGAINSTVDILTTMKERAVEAANDTNTDADRNVIQKEFDQYIDQITDNAYTNYNNINLLDGSHNYGIKSVATVFANDYLSEPDLTNPRKLTDLTDKNGENLGILASDRITISVVQDGKTYSKTYDVVDNTLAEIIAGNQKIHNADGTLRDVFKDEIEKDGFMGGISFWDSQKYYGYDGFDNKVAPPSGKKTTVISVGIDTAPTPAGDEPPIYHEDDRGLNHQLGGITISITDRYGNARTSANAKLNQFHEVIRAQNASPDNALNLQVGTKAGQTIRIGLTDMRAYALALQGKDGKTISISTQLDANASIEVLDNALSKALDQQTAIGAAQSRLEYTYSNLLTARTNVQSAESVIRDADMAKEMTDFTKENILSQTAQSMLAQSNQSTSNVLSLLQ